MTFVRNLGAVLLALFLICAPIAAQDFHAPSDQATLENPVQHSHGSTWLNVALGLALVGTVTGPLYYVGNGRKQGLSANGGTVAPTAALMAKHNRLACQIGWADADTTVTITHNWNLQSGETGALQPDVIIEQVSGGTAYPGYTIVATAANSITLGKGATATGSGGTFNVKIYRPTTSSL